tara:strand:- start:452 stop:1282 length:831 start_codon:yes stop_codon:yes gene_type:complete
MSESAHANLRVMKDLLDIMSRLRDPNEGCPWDLRQDFESIVPFTIEETYELAEAIALGDYDQVRDELGDVLFQVIFYAQIASERQLFNFKDVAEGISRKLIRRHPHIFDNPDGEPVSESDVKDRWEQIKASERQNKQLPGAMDDVPKALPALSRAQKLQKRAARVGFDWPELDGVRSKINEEMMELDEAICVGNRAGIEAEIGDVFLATVNLARHLGIDAETSLRRASTRFEQRFRFMERSAASEGVDLDSESLDELEARWQKAKSHLGATDLSQG